jgi:hypothetical protein
MNSTDRVQETETGTNEKSQVKLQIAQYLEQQPESMRVFHRWMKVLEWVSLGVVAIIFILALYVSFNWTQVQAKAIPTAWFAFPASFSLTLLLLGIHTVILKAFPPVSWFRNATWRVASPIAPTAKTLKFTTGREAIGSGWLVIAGALLLGAFWGAFIYASWTVNWAMLKPLITILAIVFAVGFVISLISTTLQKVSKSH